MLSHLLKDIKLDNLPNFAVIETATIESACSDLDAEQLKQILKLYTSVEDMFTGKYLHGTNQHIKLLVDMGKSVDQSRDEADVMYGTLATREVQEDETTTHGSQWHDRRVGTADQCSR